MFPIVGNIKLNITARAAQTYFINIIFRLIFAPPKTYIWLHILSAASMLSESPVTTAWRGKVQISGNNSNIKTACTKRLTAD
jgi:hypothetical protein